MSMEAIMYRLRGWAKIAREDRGVLTFGPDEADAILARLERFERLDAAALEFARLWADTDTWDDMRRAALS